MIDQQYDVQQIAANEVAPEGESVAWCGRPNPIRMMRKMMPIVLFAIPWTAFSLFWVYAASGFQFFPDFSEGGFAFFPLFGVPFVLIGLGMFLSPVYQYVKAFRTIYIITDKTARIVVSGRTKKVNTYSRADIETIQRTEKKDGSGDLIFKNEISFFSKGGRRVNAIGFFGIQNVRSAEQYLTRIRDSSPSHQ